MPLLLLFPSAVSTAGEAVAAATSAAGNLLLPVITFVGGVLVSFLVAVLSPPPDSPCLGGVLLTLPVVALQGDFDSTIDDGGGFGGGSTTVSSDAVFAAALTTCCDGGVGGG